MSEKLIIAAPSTERMNKRDCRRIKTASFPDPVNTRRTRKEEES